MYTFFIKCSKINDLNEQLEQLNTEKQNLKEEIENTKNEKNEFEDKLSLYTEAGIKKIMEPFYWLKERLKENETQYKNQLQELKKRKNELNNADYNEHLNLINIQYNTTKTAWDQEMPKTQKECNNKLKTYQKEKEELEKTIISLNQKEAELSNKIQDKDREIKITELLVQNENKQQEIRRQNELNEERKAEDLKTIIPPYASNNIYSREKKNPYSYNFNAYLGASNKYTSTEKTEDSKGMQIFGILVVVSSIIGIIVYRIKKKNSTSIK